MKRSNLDRAIEAMETARWLLLAAFSDAGQQDGGTRRAEERELGHSLRLLEDAGAKARLARDLAGGRPGLASYQPVTLRVEGEEGQG